MSSGRARAGILLARTRGAETDLVERLELRPLALESRLLRLEERSLAATPLGPWLAMALEHKAPLPR